MSAPKTVEIGAKGLEDLFARREAKKDQRPGLASISDEKRDEMRRMMIEFHTPVNKRDGKLCTYCLLFEGRERPAANYADHLLTQRLFPELKFSIWNGVACCKWCNEKRGVFAYYQACVMQTRAGVIQFVGMSGRWFGRLLAPSAEDENGNHIWKGYGDHVGDWKEIPVEESKQLRNNVLLKGAA